MFENGECEALDYSCWFILLVTNVLCTQKNVLWAWCHFTYFFLDVLIHCELLVLRATAGKYLKTAVHWIAGLYFSVSSIGVSYWLTKKEYTVVSEKSILMDEGRISPWNLARGNSQMAFIWGRLVIQSKYWIFVFPSSLDNLVMLNSTWKSGVRSTQRCTVFLWTSCFA